MDTFGLMSADPGAKVDKPMVPGYEVEPSPGPAHLRPAWLQVTSQEALVCSWGPFLNLLFFLEKCFNSKLWLPHLHKLMNLTQLLCVCWLSGP